MEELTYDFLTEVQGRWQADLIKSYFEACGIDVELFQESLGQHIYPTTLDILGNVQIYVPKTQLKAARKLLDEYFNPPHEEEIVKPRAIKKSTRTTSRKKEAASKITRRKAIGKKEDASKTTRRKTK